MRILLVGEYSRLHNSLKEGLIALGHEVLLISTGDYFKQYPSDLLLKRKYQTGLLKKIKVVLYRLFYIDITSIAIKNQFFKHKESLKGWDVVQLINESPFGILPKHEMAIINFLQLNNSKLFLLSCGADYSSIKYLLEKKSGYDILWGYKNNSVPKKYYDFALKYTKPAFKKLHEFIFNKIDGVIASDLDYVDALKTNPKYLGLIPNPINTQILQVLPLKYSKKINIFLGVNRGNYHTKGIQFFEKALVILNKTHPHKFKLIRVENLPYQEYIKKYNKAHIILDQVLGIDQGYNALEAMAKGKVVFTGAEQQWLDYYHLEENNVAINALPDPEKIAQELAYLIDNQEKIKAIGKNARFFIEKEHQYIEVAKKYVKAWENK